MLGWEYPPHISGGLGTACEGLTKALSRHDIDLTFVVPHLFGGERASHMRLLDGQGEENGVVRSSGSESPSDSAKRPRTRTVKVPSFLAPYLTPDSYRQWIQELRERKANKTLEQLDELGLPRPKGDGAFDRYSGDIFAEVERFAGDILDLFSHGDFDVIHAHDWLTFPAAVALAGITKKPLVVHVHSLEYDRSGQAVNERINAIERWGMEAATQVVAVSYYTRSIINRFHNVPLEKISVVHNGVYPSSTVQRYRRERELHSKIVLFLGRITFQKGPDYLVEAAAKVVPHAPDVLFVIAGSGDMVPQLKRRIAALGLEKHFYFPGFLKGPEVEQMFSLADVYVMPSVSEPFGISALEAINYDTPVIISRQSGVSEVLGHALKVDFWDIDKLADLIINALIHEELRADMVSMAREELKRLHWGASAVKTLEVYRAVLQKTALSEDGIQV